MTKNKLWIGIIVVIVVIAATGLAWMRIKRELFRLHEIATQPDNIMMEVGALSSQTTLPDQESKSVSEVDAESALAYLQDLQEVVYRVTYESKLNYTDDDGQSVERVLTAINKVSVTPELHVWITERDLVADDELVETPARQEPSYYIYHPDGKVTSYIYTDRWYTGESEDIWYGLGSDRVYAHTWAVKETPWQIADGVFRAHDRDGEESYYDFFFDQAGKLSRVEWTNPDTTDHHVYEILDEPVIREIPVAVVETAVPFEM